MRHVAKALALALVLALLVPNLVLAGDYLTDAVQALQRAPVYVAPGTEGTNNDTSSKLQTGLNSDDNIILVMLPAAAETELGSDLTVIANRLSEMLGNKHIIGLAVGKKVVGYAPTLPAGVAADQMKRAESVSNDPVTALGTFVQNIRLWKSTHPQPTPIPPALPKEEGFSWPAWLIGVLVVVSLILSYKTANYLLTLRDQGKVGFKAPDQIKDLLERIAKDRQQVRDQRLREALYQVCIDIVRYFKSSSKDKRADSLFFKDRLTEVVKVLEKYIDIQENPRYYNMPDALLEQGKEALSDFGQYVLESIRRGNEADLVAYKVDADILQAHRLMANPEEEFNRALNGTDRKIKRY